MDKIKKVFSPGKDKDDEVMYGTPSKEGVTTEGTTQAHPTSTLETEPEAGQKDKGVFRQIFNPGGDKYSEQSYGTTATAEPTMSDQLQKESASSEPLRGAETSQFNNDRVQQESLHSTSGSATAPSGTSSRGPSTMAREDNQDDVSNATFTARSYALGSGHSADPQQTSTHVDQATQATTELGPTGDEPSQAQHGRRLDHSLAGAATGGAGAGYVGADELNEFMKHGRDPEADQATYRSRDYYLGSSSDANPFQQPGHELGSGVQSTGAMAPRHIPGEFPSEDGSDPHSGSSGIGSGAAAGVGAGAAGIAASRAYNDHKTTEPSGQAGSSAPPLETSDSPIQTTTNTVRSGSFSKPGQDPTPAGKSEEKEKSGGFKGALAAATAAMGLGGAGAYAASKDDKQDPASQPQTAASSSQTAPTTAQASRNAGSSNVAPGSVVSEKTQEYTHHRPGQTSSTQKDSPTPAASRSQRSEEEEDHTARNTALGAGAVGAGAGAYALGRDRESNEPRSDVRDQGQSYEASRPSEPTSTLQPTQSRTTASDVQSRQPETESHTARNTALGAGAAAGAAGGAYALGRNDNDGTSRSTTDGPESVVSEKTQAYHRHRASDSNPTSQSTGTATSSSVPAAQSQPSRGEDTSARNAALAGGAASATGAGYALSKGDRDNADNAQSVVSPETQLYTGSHPTDASSTQQSTSTSRPAGQPQSTGYPQQPREEDHSARNAASGTGLGATGAGGAYAFGRDNDKNDGGNTLSVVSPETQKYVGSHPEPSRTTETTSSTKYTEPVASSRPANTADSSARPDAPRQQDDHTARNAALGAGAGAAGAGAAYGLSRDENNAGNAQSVVSPETQKYVGSHPESTGSSAPTSSSQPRNTTDYSSESTVPHQQEDHTARNAALGAGTAGAAGAAAYGLSRDDDRGVAESAVSPETQKYTGSHAEPARTTETTKTTSSAPKSTSKPTETSDRGKPVKQPRDEDNTARNAALGTGAAGAAGGAYALNREDDERGETAQTVGAPDNQRYTGSQPQSTNTTTTTTTTTTARAPTSNVPSRTTAGYGGQAREGRQDDYTTEATVLGAGTAAAGGAGAYAATRGGNDTGPASKTVGPHESNVANVLDPRVTPAQFPTSEKSTAGPYPSADPRVTSDPARAQQQEREPESHYGRDAAIVGGAGAAGAAGGYGAHQYANRDQPPQQYAPQQQQQQQQPQQYAAPQEKHKEPKHEKVKETKETHHHKEPKHEKEAKHEKEPQLDTQREPEHDPRVVAGADGHNKLHKKAVDPESEDHTGRNAALAGAGAGTAGIAGKEYSDTQPPEQSEEGEKKHGLLHKILHPREHKREKEEEERRRSSDNRRSVEQQRQPVAASPAVATGPSAVDPASTSSAGQGVVTEPHTGLPMNVEKFGTGAGGTDGSATIEGYHEGQSGGVGGPTRRTS